MEQNEVDLQRKIDALVQHEAQLRVQYAPLESKCQSLEIEVARLRQTATEATEAWARKEELLEVMTDCD